MKKLLFATLSFLSFMTMNAQMWNGQDTLYGNEWIDYDAADRYYKILVAEDGLYRIDYNTLNNFIPNLNSLSADQFQLFHLGQEVPIYLNTTGTLGNGDYLEFFGERNRASIDKYLFKNPKDELLNPDYSMFTDTAAYFLTWTDSGSPARFNEIPNELNGQTNPVTSFEYQLTQSFTTVNAKKTVSGGNVRIAESHYDVGEGFSGTYSTDEQAIFNLNGLISNGVNGKIILHYLGSTRDHSVEIKLNDALLATDEFSDFAFQQHEFDIAADNLTDEMVLRLSGTLDANDKNALAYIEFSYPRNFDFSGESYMQFTLASSNQNQYLEIQNFDGSNNIVLYDLTNQLRLIPVFDNGVLKINLPPSNDARSLVLANIESTMNTVANLQQKTFTNYFDAQGSFVIITHPVFFNDGSGNNWVQKYADYRQSMEGGGHVTTIVNIEDLYDQFAYGLNRHPLSIRNFGHFIQKFWEEPQFVFIVGKAMQYEQFRTPEQVEAAHLKTFFVPTFGNPGGDNLLLADNFSARPIFPIGRLAVTSAKDVETYYDKVTSFERQQQLPQSLKGKGWMKKIAHFGGGGSIGEQNSIKNHLNNFGNIIENNDFGGDVFSFFKTSTDPIQNSQTEDIKETIRTGISMMTFFGHSSANGFDFALDTPENYANEDRYPLMMSFGCFSGRCHESNVSIGERFVLAEKSGAAAYMATTGFGYVSSLGTFGNQFYGLLGGDMYGESVGLILQSVIGNMQNFGFIGDKTLAQQITFQGDPSLKVNAHDAPDYIADISSVSHEPQLLNTSLDDFQFNFSIHNIGQGTQDSFWISISQQLPNGQTTELLRERVVAPKFKNDFSYQLPIINQEILGLNRFFIELDIENEIDELPLPAAESNNQLLNEAGIAGYPILIVSNDLVPIYPPDFSILNEPDIVLKASTANPFSEEQDYIMEIDTSANFNSILKQQHFIRSKGGVLKWEPSMDFANETVYYWRVSQDSSSVSGYRWAGQSFLYNEDLSQGWNQSHYYQYLGNDFSNLEFGNNRSLKFVDDIKDLEIQNNPRVGFDFRPSFYFNSDRLNWWNPPLSQGVFIAVLDGASGLPLADPPGSVYGEDGFNGNCLAFKTNNAEQREEIITFLDDTVKDGDYVIFMTIQTPTGGYFPEDWALDSTVTASNRNLFQVLEDHGGVQARQLEEGSVPYVLAYKKNDPAYEPLEFLSDTISGIFTTIQITGVWNEGFTTSDPIGPAKEWDTFAWELQDVEMEDSIFMQILGVDVNGNEAVLVDLITDNTTDISMIDATVYPFLKLRYRLFDEINRTPPQYEFWRVIYEELPDAAINPILDFSVNKDSLEQGEQYQLSIGIENITSLDMDSLLVRYKIFDTNNQEQQFEQRLAPLLSDQVLTTSLSFDTKDAVGTQMVLIEVNPDGDQPEMTHINNIGNLNFYVNADSRNPLLDVTFDGQHIMNGDLISPDPTIVISLEDENEFLALSDTSLFNIFIQYPTIEDPVLIPFDSEIMTFTPANENNLVGENRAKVELRPQFIEDGIYNLIVQARDVTGNQSGELDYKVSFEIITQSMLSSFLNYPNPFSTSTRFVYTMTGNEQPAFFKIQILTVSGRVVKEVSQTEFGELKTGTHTSDFEWNGTDEFGDKLANGVYLYRIIAKDADGQPIENFETGGDQYFSKGYGKMVLVR